MSEVYSINCPQHRKEQVLYTCTHCQCSRLSMVCAACPDSHGDHSHALLPFSEWVKTISKNIESAQKQQSFLNESLSKYAQILKWCEDDEMHLRKVEEHCKAQKALIAEDIREARDLFAEMCYEAQTKLDAQLEDFFRAYKESFKTCKIALDDSVQVQRKYAAYSNPNNLILRLQQSTNRETQDFSQGLKRMSSRVQQLKSDRKGYIDSLTSVSERLTDIANNLPVYQFQQGLETLSRQLGDTLQNHLRSKLTCNIPNIQSNSIAYNPPGSPMNNGLMKENIVKGQQQSMTNKTFGIQKSPQRHQSQQPTQNQNCILPNNKNLLIGTPNLNSRDATLKPLKKYQLDFLVSGVEVISDNLFALTCSSDPYLRVFDTLQKRIHTLQAHVNPITSLCKWTDCGIQTLGPNFNILNQGKNQKTPFLFTLSNDAVIVWTFETPISNSQSGQCTIPHILHKYVFPTVGQITSMSPLYDGSCIMLGDIEGAIEVYNYQNQRVHQVPLRGKHTRAITTIQVMKRFDKAVVGSLDESISVWRLAYSNSNGQSVLDSAYCEHILPLRSGVVNIGLLNATPNLIMVFTNEGSMKLVDVLQMRLVVESDDLKGCGGVVDYLIAEDRSKGIEHQLQLKKTESFCIIALTQSSKSVRLWRVQQNNDKFSHQESRVELAITPHESNIHGSKIQFVHMTQNSQNPLVLVANELNKELLVYEVISKSL